MVFRIVCRPAGLQAIAQRMFIFYTITLHGCPGLLVGLPYLLLQDAGTRVASENTVVYTIQQWFHKQTAAERPPRKQVNELVQLVRIKRCSQLFVASRMFESALKHAASRLAQQCFSQTELRLVCLISGTATAGVPERKALFPYADDCLSCGSTPHGMLRSGQHQLCRRSHSPGSCPFLSRRAYCRKRCSLARVAVTR